MREKFRRLKFFVAAVFLVMICNFVNMQTFASGKGTIKLAALNGGSEKSEGVKKKNNTKKKRPKSIILNTKKASMFVGNKKTLRVKSVKPRGASKSVRWTTSNKKVAVVNSKGVVTAKGNGKVTIKAISKVNKKISASCKLNIYKKTSKLQLKCDNSYVKTVGDSFVVSAEVTKPKKGAMPVRWSSSNNKVASVSAKGKVHCLRTGETTLLASSGKKKVKVSLKVKKKIPEQPEEPKADSVYLNNSSNSGYASAYGNQYYLLLTDSDAGNHGLFTGENGDVKVKKLNALPSNKRMLNAYGDSCYYALTFSLDDQTGIYRYDIKSGKNILITSDCPDSMIVFEGYIYYTLESSKATNSIWRIKIDGSGKQCLYENCIYDLGTFNICDGMLYFADAGNDHHLTRMKLDGSDILEIDNLEVNYIGSIMIDNGWIYYPVVIGRDRLANSISEIYRVRLDGTQRQKILGEDAYEFFVYDNWLFYVTASPEDPMLCKIKLDGTQRQILDSSKESYYGLAVVNESLVYMTAWNRFSSRAMYYRNLASGELGKFQVIN